MYRFDANSIYDIDGDVILRKILKEYLEFGVCITDYSSIRKWYDPVINHAIDVLNQEIQSLQKKPQISVVRDLNGMISLKENLENELQSRYPTSLDEDLVRYTRAGYASLVQNTLRKGAFIDTREDGLGGPTPLMIAATNNDYELVKSLKKKGSNVNMQNSLGNNSLMAMVENKKPIGFNSFNLKYSEMMHTGKFLIDNDVDRDIVNEHNENAFELALTNGYNDFALMVREYDPNSLRSRYIFTPSNPPIIWL